MNAMTRAHWRAARLLTLRAEMKQIWREGGMSDAELSDVVNMLIAQCSPEQHDAKKRLLTIAQDLDLDEPDADAFRGLGQATLDQSERIPVAAFHPWSGLAARTFAREE